MAKFKTALSSILCEAGYTASAAIHIERCLDRLRLAGLGSDDLASALLRWRQEAIEYRLWLDVELAKKYSASPSDLGTLYDPVMRSQATGG